ncbi:very-long-chain (3R)-3-hydroxyacyl-CoA dehydratase PASTICCINO 2A [Carex littledalei]|uniref:very-long-chain (3R)-3-hydroxyacyl-CoA dehydratase n=1 Tax=Carex littledalei TaxID=544730 RepID=A0A833RW43_9POAL|nr:very-long-chain (3R)-3-hydroxyacyl-CoA dehydratase PASTICCINO 2A [Carex littledalei]
MQQQQQQNAALMRCFAHPSMAKIFLCGTRREYASLIQGNGEDLELSVLHQGIIFQLVTHDYFSEDRTINYGGEEASLFAMDIFKMYNKYPASSSEIMYEKYSHKNGWKFDVIQVMESDLKGYKEASGAISGTGAYGKLKFETGIHRVQRVPLTEKSGRVHTSAVSVAILPQADEVLIFSIKALNESGLAIVYHDIIHGLIGLVRSPVSATLATNWVFRLFVTWGILYHFPETRTHVLVGSLVISWSLIIRYSFLCMKEALGFTPSWLLWLRKSVYFANKPWASDKYCLRIPNKWNLSFDYHLTSIAVLGISLPGSPQMYTYLLGQRKKALSKLKVV